MLRSAAGGNVLDKMPQEGLAIIERSQNSLLKESLLMIQENEAKSITKSVVVFHYGWTPDSTADVKRNSEVTKDTSYQALRHPPPPLVHELTKDKETH
ncbi:hypothetical protein Tco_0149887 [Tanacetum coccineum]